MVADCGVTWFNLPTARGTSRFGRRREMKRSMRLAMAVVAGLSAAGTAQAALIGQWTGDNYTAGNWTDSSGNNNTGTAVGAPVALPGTPLAFNGHKSVAFAGADY